ncbi:hypothetical protein SRHO_G00277200, partial [Serrasalmus rhombeus]
SPASLRGSSPSKKLRFFFFFFFFLVSWPRPLLTRMNDFTFPSGFPSRSRDLPAFFTGAPQARSQSSLSLALALSRSLSLSRSVTRIAASSALLQRTSLLTSPLLRKTSETQRKAKPRTV